MKKGLLFYVGLLSVLVVSAQKVKKPSVLIYGENVAAFAAAMQSAKSDVPTLWVVSSSTIADDFLLGTNSIDNTFFSDGGVWMDLLMEMSGSGSRSDSLARVVKANLRSDSLINAVLRMIKEQKNLTVIYDTQLKSLKHNKKYWSVGLGNKKRLNVRVVADLSRTQDLRKLVWSHEDVSNERKIRRLNDFTSKQLRTLICSGELDGELKALQLSDLLVGEKEGFIDMIGNAELFQGNGQNIPFLAATGQAIGATAAYLAFFKTTADKIEVRKLQNELLTFGMRILPYQDVPVEDIHFVAIQKVGLATVLDREKINLSFNLQRDDDVSYAETRVVLEEIYSRAQLWRVSREDDRFTWDNFIDFVQFVGLKGNEVRRQVEKDWSDKLGFEGAFDGDAGVTRYQFSVILDKYASPYSVNITHDGSFQY
ncbi:hypothetical protein ORI89_15495 [Sphingobacterium sp. UT-1RO-CII-1]|uniref:hypothetical protein n=1 Tax=Sphingobacterium sp. UT-1RO-CII-1 TaxID=2995225 RepID=UPI00227ADB52|nr:hypothetical protein [Sphingobacterium sp. UT-1RO-CII-1]MCY4781064.1 hypothetical protein [Sphingobacterium sp. UT-1RO-CII-1]